MPKLIFDIETVGEKFEDFDPITKDNLTKWIRKEYGEGSHEYRVALEEIKNELGLSPLTGQIVAIGVLDFEKNKAAVYFQAPNSDLREFEEKGVKYKPTTEAEMLQKFWEVAKKYQEFVSFNGRGFDVPYLMIRSAIHKIRPTKDLMSNRYLYNQKFGDIHVDLYDQLSFYGASRKKGSLHLFSRAFGIKSPKTQGVAGDDVAELFAKKKYLEIARYNFGDLAATKELYEYWRTYLKQ